jgi:hypothetical protein
MANAAASRNDFVPGAPSSFARPANLKSRYPPATGYKLPATSHEPPSARSLALHSKSRLRAAVSPCKLLISNIFHA